MLSKENSGLRTDKVVKRGSRGNEGSLARFSSTRLSPRPTDSSEVVYQGCGW